MSFHRNPSRNPRILALLLAVGAMSSTQAAPFNSGSTGADGVFNPTTSVELQMPPNGIFNFASVNIPSGVTVTFKKNAANTPVIILSQGDVTINGVLSVAGGDGSTFVPGVGGPGGFDGGVGGQPQNRPGGAGMGPGGGGGGGADPLVNNNTSQGGGGGGNAVAGGINRANSTLPQNTGIGGVATGSIAMIPFVGGSGGGGGAGGATVTDGFGGSGGGGGGALMIVASGRISTANSSNRIYAVGGDGAGCQSGTADGGGGAGGTVWLVASAIGTIGENVSGGNGFRCGAPRGGGNGGDGYIRIDVVTAGQFTLPITPRLAITNVGGVAVPAQPSGVGDVALPANAANPTSVTITASNIPVTSAVKVTVKPLRGVPVSVNASSLSGSLTSSSATAQVNIPPGQSTLEAQTTFTLSVAQGEELSRFAQGERVESVTLSADMSGTASATLATASGKEYVVPASVLTFGGGVVQ